MITVEQAARILKHRNDGITDAKISPDGYAVARLSSRLDPARHYTFIVDPIVDKMILRVCVVTIAKVNGGSRTIRDLARLNLALRCGCVGVEADGEVAFQINHPCSDSDGDPPPELIGRLLDDAVEAVRRVESVVLFNGMVESGIPPRRARQVLDMILGDDEEDASADEETL